MILLDLHNTFMFDVDRFSDHADYYDAYQRMGGHCLHRDQVQHYINTTFQHLHRCYQQSAKMKAFPSVRRVFQMLNVPEAEWPCLEAVFAHHECGVIPEKHAQAIERLARVYPLGVVSDIWSAKTLWIQRIEAAGLLSRFKTLVFSSDHGMVKPDRRLFDQAIKVWQVDRSEVVFVGDSYHRDVKGALDVGFKCVWLTQIPDRCGDKSVLAMPDLTAFTETMMHVK